jgi:hypothetical protein
VDAAEDGFDAGDEFVGGEGFAEVVVGAELESADFFGVGGVDGEEEDGDGAAEAEGAHDLEAGDIGEAEVEDDEVGAVFFGEFEALGAGFGGDDAEALVEEFEANEFENGGIVVDDEDECRGGHGR